MKRIGTLAAAILCISGCLVVRGTLVTSTSGDGMEELCHIVLFRFKTEATPQQIARVEKAFRQLPRQIPYIDEFEWGVEVSGRGLNKGFTHGGIFSFESEKERDLYREHSAHKAFVELATPIVEEIFVFDFWTQS